MSEQPNEESGVAEKEAQAGQRPARILDEEHPVPLFLRDVNEGRKGNAQDEKDEMEE
jgi:hypothetical protein